MPSVLEVEGLSKSFGPNKVLKDVTFSIDSRDIGTLVGPSGSGKSTLLNIISGIYEADEGTITIDGKVVESRGNSSFHTKPSERDVGYVFQDYLLFPHMSVFENISFGLKARHFSDSSTRRQVNKVLETVGLEELKDRKPSEISGGQMQRVALARALVLEPKLLLLDEPLSALDRQTREMLRVELKKIFDSIGTTVVYVTHDLDEAFFLGHQIGILHSGKLISFGRKIDLLRDLNRSTAEFLGFNIMKAQLRRTEGSELVVFVPELETEVRVPLSREKGLDPGENVLLATPPEAIRIFYDGEDSHSNARPRFTILDIWEFKDKVQIVFGTAESKRIAEVSKEEFRRLSLNRGDKVGIKITGGLLVLDND